MRLINKTTGQTITNNLKIAASLIDVSLGLLKEPKGTAMLFKTRWGIHTFFMKYPINVVILDKNMRVVQIKQNLKPNRIFFWNPIYSDIIELPLNKFNIRNGDKLKIL